MRNIGVIWQVYSDKFTMGWKRLRRNQKRRKNTAELRKEMKQRKELKEKIAFGGAQFYDIKQIDSLKEELEKIENRIKELQKEIS